MIMKVFKTLIVLLPLVFGNASAQYYETSKYSGIGIPFFEVEAFRTFAEDAEISQLHLFYEIIYDDLTFVKSDTGSGYLAQFELVAAIYDKDDRAIQSRTMNKEYQVTDYELTNSRQEKINLSQKFNMPAGEYVLKFQMYDIVSKKSANRKLDLVIDDFKGKKGTLSDIIFLQDVKKDSLGNIVKITPRVMDNLSRKSDQFFIYHNFYCSSVPSEVTFKYSLQDVKGNVHLDTTITKEVTEGLSAHIWKVNKQQLKKNRYKCIVNSEVDGDDDTKDKNLSFYWITVPETEDDIAMALRQMRYIMPPDSMDKYEDASLDDQKIFFRKFWSSRDPNPSTAVNELMEEYFKRVNYSNREFSNFNEGGWLSDRGRILIKFGFPDDVERHPFDLNSVPYVIWRYYSLRKIFVFADQSGFGDYRLLPQYMNQEFN
jgi:GWxTD domain-containing protein